MHLVTSKIGSDPVGTDPKVTVANGYSSSIRERRCKETSLGKNGWLVGALEAQMPRVVNGRWL